MSRLRSRAEIDAEPQTAQFEIQRYCDECRRIDPYNLRDLPIAMTVNLDPVRSVCGSTGYRVTETWALNQDGTKRRIRPATPGLAITLCEHSGRIIE